VVKRSDQELLESYADERDEGAFSELVRRHVDLVHSAARRMTRDEHLAEDVTQRVFMALAENAKSVARHPVLAGWLHRTARNLAANLVRGNVRRQAREEEAVWMREILSEENDGSWEELAPEVDAALGELDVSDRDLVLLRYFERKTAREIAQVLGVEYEAAQKRVARAVERLRGVLERRGVTVAVSGLGALLTAHSVEAAPVGLTLKILVASGMSAAPVSSLFVSAKILAMTTTQKIIVGGAILLAVGGGIYKSQSVTAGPHAMGRLPKPPPYKLQPRLTVAEQRQREAAVATNIARAAGGIAASKVVLRNGSAAMPFTSTRVYQFLKSKDPKLSMGQVQGYLNANGRSAMSLLAAYRTTGEADLLKEAVERFPDDPQVNFEALIRKDNSPKEQRERLEAFKKSDPENSMPNYLSALDHFKRGEGEQVVRNLVAAASKQKFQDYEVERVGGDEDAYAAAGYAAGEAKMLANHFFVTPQLVDFVELGKYLVSMADGYRKAGDEDSRRNALQLGIDLGRRFDDPAAGEPLLNQITGIRIERAALEAMDGGARYDASGKTARERLDELAQRKEAMHVITQQADGMWEHLSEQDWVNYYYQKSQAGEETALRWLVGRR
jgi:RNA polymerase sigma factor (sigma-70 family)